MKKMYDQVIGRQLERQKLIHAAEKKGPSLVEPDDDALESERKKRKKKEVYPFVWGCSRIIIIVRTKPVSVHRINKLFGVLCFSDLQRFYRKT
ncbi:hypothetical protein FOZ63_013195 [Perkinsus olseni]|nr:hypothetical protein FOZ63_013195 [Perkinsus olseni]